MKKPILLILAAGLAVAQTSNYPPALDTPSSLFVAADNVQSTLSAAVALSDTSITVASGTGFAVNQIATICDTITSTGKCTAFEHMKITVVASNILTVTRGFGGTVARTHTSGKLVTILIDKAHHDALKAAVINIETALGATLSNIAAVPISNSTLYNFTAQTPGGSLIIGANTITMAPCPAGVNGTDANHYLYISAGTGTAEAGPIIGGTCTSGATSGTVIVTAANTHSGAWTIQSATSGIEEAYQSLTANGGMVFVPTGSHPLYATLHIGDGQAADGATRAGAAQSLRNAITLAGSGSGIGSTIGNRGGATVLQWYGANGGKMVQVNGPIMGVQIRDLMFDGAPSGTIAATALYSLHAYDFRYSNLMAVRVSGFAYDITARGNQANFAAGSSGIAEWLYTSELQTTGSGLNVGAATYTTGDEDVAQVTFRNLGLQVGSSGIGLQLQFVDSCNFEFVTTMNGAIGLKVLNPTGDPNNFPTSVTFKQTYFGGTTAVSTPVGWHPTAASDIYGGLQFLPWGAEVGAPPNADGVYGFTDSNEYFNFKLYPRALTLANGANNDVAIGNAGMVRVTGPSGAYNITGFAGGRDGRVLTLVGNTGGVLTIKNQNAGSVAANRISVPGGADFALSNGIHAATFIYSGSDASWYFVAGK